MWITSQKGNDMNLSRQQKESIYEYLQTFLNIKPFEECKDQFIDYDEYLDAINTERNKKVIRQ